MMRVCLQKGRKHTISVIIYGFFGIHISFNLFLQWVSTQGKEGLYNIKTLHFETFLSALSNVKNILLSYLK